MDAAARLGFANGNFEDAPDEAIEIVEEFYPDSGPASTDPTMLTANEQAPFGLKKSMEVCKVQ